MGVRWGLFGGDDGRVVVVVGEAVGLEQAPRGTPSIGTGAALVLIDQVSPFSEKYQADVSEL
jgi:hypothetical protein